MNKVLITGSTGMLGRYLLPQCQKAGYDIVAPSRDVVNLSAPEGLYAFVKQASPSAIVHLAAETDVDLCERDPARAGLFNHLATEAIARAGRDIGAWVLYVSTSNVFGQEGKLSYNELDLPAPMNYYGRSKLWGERALERYHPHNSFIIRAGWMIGGGLSHDHKFVGKIIKQIAAGADALRAVDDKFGTITRAQSLAHFIFECIKNRPHGLCHFSSRGGTSRFEIAKAIAAFLNFKGSVSPVHSSEFPLSAPRPVFETIESLYLSHINPAFTPQDWRDDLAGYMEEFNLEKAKP